MSGEATPYLTMSVGTAGGKWWVLVRNGKREVARIHADSASHAYTLKRDFLTFTDNKLKADAQRAAAINNG